MRAPAPGPGEHGEYRPALLANLRLHHADGRRKLDVWRDFCLLAPFAADANLWDQAEVITTNAYQLDTKPLPGYTFAALPPLHDDARKGLLKSLAEHAYRAQPLRLFKCPGLEATSDANETEGEFRARLTLLAREKRDAEVETLRARFAPRLARLEEKRRTAEDRLSREQSQYDQQKFQTAISFGATILGAVLGRKLTSATNVGRATTAMRGAGRVGREREDIGRAEDRIETIDAQRVEMEAELEKEIARIQAEFDPTNPAVEMIEIPPRKADISVAPLKLLWMPWKSDARGLASPA
jgi:hypothetical protein